MKQLFMTILLVSLSNSIVDAQFAGGSGTEEDPYQVSTIDQLQLMKSFTDAHFIQINDIDASDTESWNEGKGFEPIGDDFIKFTGTYDGEEFEIIGISILREDEDNIGLFGYSENAQLKNIGLRDVKIIGNQNVGSLVGINRNEQINNSYSSGDVSGNSTIGGLVGRNWEGQIRDSHTKNFVVGSNHSVGGLVGNNRGPIRYSYTTGEVSGDSQVGGLVGVNFEGEIFETHAKGNITGSGDLIGGLVGENTQQISNSYANGIVIGEGQVGGLVGGNRGDIDNSYAQGEVKGNGNLIGGLVGRNYQSQINNCNSTGNVTGKNEIGGLVGRNQGGFNFFSPGGLIYSSNATGNVTGENYIGGLVGNNNEPIKNSFATGDVSGGNYIGGLVGNNSNAISKSFATGNILSGKISIGGLVGDNSGMINDTYAHGFVLGEKEVGGLIGINKSNGLVTTSYAKGEVSGSEEIGGLIGLNGNIVESSYWDRESSGNNIGVGRGASNGATGLTTSQMTGASAEDNMIGFDFGVTWLLTGWYPILYWQNTPYLVISPRIGLQLGVKFEIKGTNFTPEGEVHRFVKFPDEEFQQISSITADQEGNVQWSFSPGCDHPVGDTHLFAVDAATEEESNEIVQTVLKNEECDAVSEFQWPVENPVWSNGYGAFNQVGNRMYHSGIDLQNSLKNPWDYDTPVMAAANGEVVAVWDDFDDTHDLGRVVILKHNEGLYSLYGHLDSIENHIIAGVEVSKSEVLGIMGNSTKIDRNPNMSPHLHFEIKENDILGSVADQDNGVYWGYTPDLPSPYGFQDPLFSIYPAPEFLTADEAIKIITDSVRVRTGPGTNYSILGYAMADQKFYANSTALANDFGDAMPGRLWYQIHLPNSAGPNHGWIASVTNEESPLVEELEEAVIGVIVDEQADGIPLRIQPGHNNFIRVWAGQGYDTYRNVHVWSGQTFIVNQTDENEEWHEISIPKFYFYDPQSANKGAPGMDNVVGEIETAWVHDESIELEFIATSTEPVSELPSEFILHQNYPNPFNPITTIRYSLPERSNVRLEVFDLLGRRMATLVDEQQTAGYQEVQIDASNFSSGIYIYVLETHGFREMKKMTLIK